MPVSSRCSECQSEQGLLLDFMRLGAAGGRARAGAALYRQHRTIPGDAPQARQHVEERSHIRWLFLYPDDVAMRTVTSELRDQLCLGERVELFEEHDCGCRVFSFPAFVP